MMQHNDKTFIRVQWDDARKCYFIRCKVTNNGFEDELRIQFKPDAYKECIGDGEYIVLMSTSDSGEPIGVPTRITAQQLLSLLLTGGY